MEIRVKISGVRKVLEQFPKCEATEVIENTEKRLHFFDHSVNSVFSVAMRTSDLL